MTCYKYIYIDHQETGFASYGLTPRYYSSQERAEQDWHGKESCFRIIKPFRMSKQSGQMAEVLTRHERERAQDGL